MIAGQSPNLQWRDNAPGQSRTIDEAIAIARSNGVNIPEDVSFWVDELGELGPDRTARGPRVDKPDGSIVYWSDLVHDKTAKVPFRVWDGILKSDEAIIAVFAHEMYELERLRPLLKSGKVTISEFIEMTCQGNPGNFHDQAWELADRLVEQMRKSRQV
ncbi:MAG TPA: hypothetical protein PK867_12655 [Pirellulales bacterium]|nr:hypothetical protein [Pirellulales bacterium]